MEKRDRDDLFDMVEQYGYRGVVEGLAQVAKGDKEPELSKFFKDVAEDIEEDEDDGGESDDNEDDDDEREN